MPSGHCSETAANTQVSTYFHQSLEAPVISTNIRTVGLCVKTAILHQWKLMPVCPRLHIQNILINVIIQMSRNISSMKAILYQFKREVAAWKRLWFPQRMQRIWWQIMAMPYMGFRVLKCDIIYVLGLSVPRKVANWQTRGKQGSWRPPPKKTRLVGCFTSFIASVETIYCDSVWPTDAIWRHRPGEHWLR